MGTNISIVHSEPAFTVCKTCNGRGYTTCLKWGLDPDWCPECGGAKEVAIDLSDLATLAHCLAVGASLCAAHEIGRHYGDDEDARYFGWRPGCGVRAPGWGG